jgi:hypothetical protein
MMATNTLRSISLATAVPLALSTAAVGRADQSKVLRSKPPILDQTTGAAIDASPQWRVIFRPPSFVANAQTSADVILSTPRNDDSAAVAAANMSAQLFDLNWLSGPLAQIGELSLLKPEDLPNEKRIETAAVSTAAQVVVDLHDSNAPVPQITASGDGGLQLVWYTSARDLEIEVQPSGAADIIEFDGKETRRIVYSVFDTLAALAKIRACLEGTRSAA